MGGVATNRRDRAGGRAARGVERSSKIGGQRSVALFGFDAVGVLFEVGREGSSLLG